MTSSPHLVRDVMTRIVVSVTPLAEFKEIVAVMNQWRVTAVPVIEGEGASRVIGVVSEADLLPKEEFRDHATGLIEQMRRLGDTLKAGSTLAKDLMTTPAITVRPDTTLARAARIMAERHIKRLLVVDPAGTLQGIVSRTDLLKVFLRADGEIADEVRREVVGRLFPLAQHRVRVDVQRGVVTLSGGILDASLIPEAARLARAVEGVIDVNCALTTSAAQTAGA
ncbi:MULTISPECIES: CBS domain-containing protein [unclassified Streptomyces]|uniref:CBS domain-containing protein n=1 Tax=unclassified Streptomyces TaxID=2593676 RepID=UPI00226F1A31|nr:MULTISPECIES: CBS domain-containing protein [unclassified Streptomyces]MCY0922510.1 CBS domain-containing protein [Streptomyces sp. H27-G5]MCY0963175.1 CBS domain-containing protein [Streptomyces sp. H27-H5]